MGFKSNKVKHHIKWEYCLYAAALLVFAYLKYLFPYSGDDWAWGSAVGLERLSTFFQGYNGRYLGNLLVMVLTRSSFLNIVISAGMLTAMCVCIKKYSFRNSSAAFLLAFALLLLIPEKIRVQSIVWTSGFSNYVPPVFLTFLYLVMVQNIFRGQVRYRRMAPVITFVIGFAAALFMENITLYAPVLAVGIILYCLYRYKHIYAVHVAYLVGAVSGAVAMFTNSAYSRIAEAEDSYRTVATSESLGDTLAAGGRRIIQLFYFHNDVMWMCITILIVLVSVKHIIKRKSIIIMTVVFCVLHSLLLSGLIAMKYYGDMGKDEMLYATALMIAAYEVSLVVLFILAFHDRGKLFKILAVYLSIPAMNAPLLVVNPVGARNFFPAYFMQIVICALLLDELLCDIKWKKAVTYVSNGVLMAAAIWTLVGLLNIYVPIHHYDVKRNTFAVLQAEAGKETIYMCKLRGRYVWTANPKEGSFWEDRYKLFHGIDLDKKIKMISKKRLNKYAARFLQEQG